MPIDIVSPYYAAIKPFPESDRVIEISLYSNMPFTCYIVGYPESWTKAQVKDWLVNICKDYELDEVVISQFASMNGKLLNKLLKEQWLSRLPDLGDVLFDLWNELKNEQPNEQSSETDTKKEKKSGVYLAN